MLQEITNLKTYGIHDKINFNAKRLTRTEDAKLIQNNIQTQNLLEYVRNEKAYLQKTINITISHYKYVLP